MNKKLTKIISWVLVALLILSVISVMLYALAAAL